jgi:hypothetical protein
MNKHKHKQAESTEALHENKTTVKDVSPVPISTSTRRESKDVSNGHP